MNIISKGLPESMRVIALPLARIKLKQSDPSANNLLVFYHFDLISPHAGRKSPSMHKKVLNSVMKKAADLWTGLGKAPKGSWKLWTYESGERIADQIEFEELAIRSVDPSLGPIVSTRTSTKQVKDVTKDWSPDSLPKIPLIYPPSLYPVGADPALYPPLTHLQTLLASRGPRHRRGFYIWMLIVPFTLPITLIPIIPNLPFFFCVWRSWSHYRAYKSSQYLSSLLDGGLIDPHPSLELDKLYASFSLSSEKTPTFGNDAIDEKAKAASSTGSSESGCILTHGAVPRVLEMFHLTGSTATDIHRAMNQAYARLGKSP